MKELIAEIKSRAIQIAVVDGELEVISEDELDTAFIQKIKQHKQDLIHLLKEYNVEGTQNELIPVEIQKNYPLTNAQKRLWTVCQIDDNSKAYTISSIEFLQHVDFEIFKKSVASVIERHESLRTVFKEDENGEIRQWILPFGSIHFTVSLIDCTTKDIAENVAKNHIETEKYKAFDLENGPLMRTSLYQLSSKNFLFHINMHHIISDAISMHILLNDVMVCYAAYQQNKTPQLAPLPIQYKDYAVWQLNHKESSTYTTHQSYWLKRFSGDLPVLDLGSKNIRPKILTNNGAILHTLIDTSVTQKATEFVAENGGTLFLFLLSAWNVLLTRYASQNEIIIGTTVSDRNHVDLKNQVGFYMEALPLRTKINWETNFKTLYKQITEHTLLDFLHDSYPFDDLVSDLKLERDVSRNPLFDVMFTLDEDVPASVAITPEKETSIHETTTQTSFSKYDLDIKIRKVEGERLRLGITYNKDIYKENFIEQLMTNYCQLLEVLLSQTTETLGKINFLIESETTTYIEEFNKQTNAFPEIEFVTTLFEKNARKHSNSIALAVGSETLTYRELDEKSNQFANYLLSKGVSKGDYVPLYIERSLEMVVSILGIFKSGAVYIPIDVHLPKERMQYILNDIQANYLVTKPALENNIVPSSEMQILHVDFEQLALISSGYPNKKISGDSEAYIIYTSGTTEKPKGVVLSHQNLGTFLMNVEEHFKNISSQPLLASSGFDIFLFELFNPFLSGGTAILLKDTQVRDLDYLLSVLENVAAFHAVPVLMTQIVQFIKRNKIKDKYANVKELYIGGDEVPTHVLEDMYEVFPNATIHVFYGPTEGTVFVTTKNYERKNTNFKGAVIGTPNICSKIFILDDYENAVPFGVTGELCIGGFQVGKGYLNNQKLTSEKFIQNPFQPTEKIYKTGDLAQWLPDGNITFVGRRDNQVKIRGHRIELEEIVKRLQSKSEIDKAIVLVKGIQEQKELVAYIVSSETIDVLELRSFLSNTLPNYMIPSYFIRLQEFPQTANGKLDKQALPNPADVDLNATAKYIAPTNDIEETLATLWQNILHHHGKVSINDNFFSLGGDSIKAIRIISDINKKYGVKINVGFFFHQPTITSLASAISNQHKLTVQP
ncbi:amino acid adenylation domain-containing protein [Kordia periserrulae]|uniref:Amino acid adenylation domain-containing protein n=1 Tax=Kordia periserrulae TaxID=701523 RepID=A0A2T6C4D4_9FLAO|nr:non-ribosomal peptide synthetase [Kordia periserrulae]PTX63147.1 amino acid adenylation domain-containing protein [Kordia periserrulae]